MFNECICTLLRIMVACMIVYMPVPRPINENRCRYILNVLTGYEFISTRDIPWLVNPLTNRRLEIDCYCDELRLAVEVNGDQHYKSDAYYTTDLEYQVYKDRVKEKLCYMNGITLIIIPYIITRSMLVPYIIEKLTLLSTLQYEC